MTDVYFWGCVQSVGHYLWGFKGGRLANVRHDGRVPWKLVDGVLCPGADHNGYAESYRQVEGQAKLHHRDGWTALAWWDRSVDRRGGANAALFARGVLPAQEVVRLGRDRFQFVMQRFDYPIIVSGVTL
jgi:hypothetical protein